MIDTNPQPNLQSIEERIDTPLEMLSRDVFEDKDSERTGYLVENEEIVGFRLESYKMDLDYIDFEELTAFGDIRFLSLRSIHPTNWRIINKMKSLVWLRFTHALLEFHNLDFLRHRQNCAIWICPTMI